MLRWIFWATMVGPVIFPNDAHALSTSNLPLKPMEGPCSRFIPVGNNRKCICTAPELGRGPETNPLDIALARLILGGSSNMNTT